MKLELKTRSLGRIARLRDFVEQQLQDLKHELAITTAQVTLEQDTSQAPAFRATALLMVPGPDLRAAGCDHTLLAAWLKVANELKRQIRERKSQKIVQLKGKLQLRGRSGCRA